MSRMAESFPTEFLTQSALCTDKILAVLRSPYLIVRTRTVWGRDCVRVLTSQPLQPTRAKLMTKFIRIHIPAVALLLGGFTALTDRALAQPGVPLWTNYSVVYPQHLTPTDDYGNHLLTTDNNGNVIVAGTAYPAFNDYATVKISSSGVSLWTNRFSGPGNNRDVAFAVAVDNANNVFVTGYGTYSALDTDYVTIKYSSGGVPLWTNRYNGPAGSYDVAASMIVDTGGNVLVTGTSRGTGGNIEWATVKYSNSGALRWARRYGDPGGADAWVASVAVDNANVYVAGYNAAGEFATVAYSSLTGTPLWTNNYGRGYSLSRVQEVVADNNGHVFVTGSFSKHDMPQFDQDYVTLAYSSAGVPLWTNRFEGLGLSHDNDDRAVGLTVSGGNVFVLGSSMGPDSYQDFATVAYSTTGALLWTNRFSGDWGHDFPAAIASDAGNVFVTGLRGDAALNTSYCVTLAYSGAGARLWSRELTYDIITPIEIAVDSSGNVFITGYGLSSGVTIKYAALPRLVLQWVNGRLVISWTSPGCNLQSSPNVTGPYITIPGAASPYTNAPSGGQQFFRLRCN